MSKSYELYVEYRDEWENACEKDYHIDGPVTQQVIKNGIILPPQKINDRCIYEDWGGSSLSGGVCDVDGNFIDGHLYESLDPFYPNNNLWGAYSLPQEIPFVEETVVYGGLLVNAYGHATTENLCRMWWFTENPDCEYKFVFLLQHGEKYDYLDFFQMLGIRAENIVILKEPTRFLKIIVPDQSMYLNNGYKEKASLVYNAIRDSVTPGQKEKIYITRSKLTQKQIFNEEFFENFYRTLGYDIVAMEQLPLREQIAILAGAKDVVTSSGASHLQLLFCQDGVNITVLNRTNNAYQFVAECWVYKFRNATCTFIDVAVNPLPTVWFQGVQLFMPTIYWKHYVNDRGYNINTEYIVPSEVLLLEYIKCWAKTTASAHLIWWHLNVMRDCTPADIIIGFNRLFNFDIDEAAIGRLRVAFPHLERSFVKERESLAKRVIMLNSLKLMVKSAREAAG